MNKFDRRSIVFIGVILVVLLAGAFFAKTTYSNDYVSQGFTQYRISIISINRERIVVTMHNNAEVPVVCQISSDAGDEFFFELDEFSKSRPYSLALPIYSLDFGCSY